MNTTTASHRRGRIFPEIQWTEAQLASREAEREAFYQRCYPIFERTKLQFIVTHHNWFMAIEPDSEDIFIDRDLQVVSRKCQAKYPTKLHYTFRINESGVCGTI